MFPLLIAWISCWTNSRVEVIWYNMTPICRHCKGIHLLHLYQQLAVNLEATAAPSDGHHCSLIRGDRCEQLNVTDTTDHRRLNENRTKRNESSVSVIAKKKKKKNQMRVCVADDRYSLSQRTNYSLTNTQSEKSCCHRNNFHTTRPLWGESCS